MASCPKCGKGKIKKRNGLRKCKHCGPLSEPRIDGKMAPNPFGSCFDAAAHNFIGNMEVESMVMCHGIGIANYPGQEGQRICHAWIEFDHPQGRAAMDPIWLMAQPVDIYRKNFQVELVVEYSKDDFIAKWKETGFPGPWDERVWALTKEAKGKAA